MNGIGNKRVWNINGYVIEFLSITGMIASSRSRHPLTFPFDILEGIAHMPQICSKIHNRPFKTLYRPVVKKM